MMMKQWKESSQTIINPSKQNYYFFVFYILSFLSNFFGAEKLVNNSKSPISNEILMIKNLK
jgi:hypothetical protein